MTMNEKVSLFWATTLSNKRTALLDLNAPLVALSSGHAQQTEVQPYHDHNDYHAATQPYRGLQQGSVFGVYRVGMSAENVGTRIVPEVPV